MKCRDCPRFDQDSERCRDGKVNPESYEAAMNVSQILGLRSICTFNEHRERLIENRSQGRQSFRR